MLNPIKLLTMFLASYTIATTDEKPNPKVSILLPIICGYGGYSDQKEENKEFVDHCMDEANSPAIAQASYQFGRLLGMYSPEPILAAGEVRLDHDKKYAYLINEEGKIMNPRSEDIPQHSDTITDAPSEIEDILKELKDLEENIRLTTQFAQHRLSLLRSMQWLLPDENNVPNHEDNEAKQVSCFVKNI